MKSNQRLLVFIGAIILFILLLLLLNSNSRKKIGSSIPVPDAWEEQLLILTNNERTKMGLVPLTLDPKLTEIARLHSADMSEQNYFSHNNLEGETPKQRATKAGYTATVIAQNISSGYSAPELVLQSWMNSPGHRGLILGKYTRIGVGGVIKADCKGTPVWTEMYSD